jgi:hypothetical protein
VADAPGGLSVWGHRTRRGRTNAASTEPDLEPVLVVSGGGSLAPATPRAICDPWLSRSTTEPSRSDPGALTSTVHVFDRFGLPSEAAGFTSTMNDARSGPSTGWVG